MSTFIKFFILSLLVSSIECQGNCYLYGNDCNACLIKDSQCYWKDNFCFDQQSPNDIFKDTDCGDRSQFCYSDFSQAKQKDENDRKYTMRIKQPDLIAYDSQKIIQAGYSCTFIINGYGPQIKGRDKGQSLTYKIQPQGLNNGFPTDFKGKALYQRKNKQTDAIIEQRVENLLLGGEVTFTDGALSNEYSVIQLIVFNLNDQQTQKFQIVVVENFQIKGGLYSNQLAPGAIIGIAVGVTVFVCILSIIGFIYYRKKKLLEELDVLDENEERYLEIFEIRRDINKLEKQIRNEYDNEHLKKQRNQLLQKLEDVKERQLNELLDLFQYISYADACILPQINQHTESNLNRSKTEAAPARLDQQECPICMESYDIDDMVYKMPCSHFCHEECTQKWFLSKNQEKAQRCPFCNIKLSLSSLREGKNEKLAAQTDQSQVQQIFDLTQKSPLVGPSVKLSKVTPLKSDEDLQKKKQTVQIQMTHRDSILKDGFGNEVRNSYQNLPQAPRAQEEPKERQNLLSDYEDLLQMKEFVDKDQIKS